MIAFWVFFLDVALCSLNAGYYAADGNPLNLAAAVFIGFLAIFQIASWHRYG